MQTALRVAQRHRSLGLITADVLAWLVAAFTAGLIRYDFGGLPGVHVVLLGLVSAVVYVALGAAYRLHHGRSQVGSLDDILLLTPIAAVTGFVTFMVNLELVWVGRSIPVGYMFIFLVLASSWRAIWRAYADPAAHRRPRRDSSVPVLVVGAGQGGRDLVTSMLHDRDRTWHPVGMLDDDPHKRFLRVRGVPVLGPLSSLAEQIRATEAEAVVLAIPSAGSELVADVQGVARRAGVELKVLPSSSQIFSSHVGIRDLRDIDLTDVLGRNQLDTDVSAIAQYLTGRRVLVTGAGGSIGSELCRQINQYGPAELMMLDRDESALHAVQLSLTGRGLLDTDDVILCDIRDQAAVREIFLRRRPDVVFHAAALKHLPMLEQYPAEALKTNVHGTRVVLEAARLAGVERFVNISTDKAADPTCVLGYSKRIAERLTATHARQTDTGTYLSVRFGNVLGSRGSVLTTFAKQIAEGGPLTVTDPGVTRYFMTIEEACQLVVQAAAIGRPGEALVLDMGEPMRILDVARGLIRQSGRDIDIEFTGLRPGEKMHEDLFGDDEPRDDRPVHPMVSHVPVPPVDEADVEGLPALLPAPDVAGAMATLAGHSYPDERIEELAGGSGGGSGEERRVS